MPLSVRTQVRFVDLDGMGHVNNAVFLSYCELARMEFFRQYFKIENPFDFPFILARAEVDYLRPLSLATPWVAVEIGVARIGDRSWDFSYNIADPQNKTNFARVRTVQVSYDYRAGASTTLPADMRRVLERDLAETQARAAAQQ